KRALFLVSFLIIVSPSSWAQIKLLNNGIAEDLTYYENGNIMEKGYFKNGSKAGKWVEYYENQQRKSVKYYNENGEPIGKWTTWYENGQKWNSVSYENGKVEGAWTYWYKNGNKWHQLSYNNGQLQGDWAYWRKSGEKAGRGIYKVDTTKG
ncbi:MAG TPA: hypothetical protein EYN51_01640, partial [Flavobacteriales bacterium]|nr:hypothetical protein [Flavobacteriales bacterium]